VPRHAARLADRERAGCPQPVSACARSSDGSRAGGGRRPASNRIGRVSHMEQGVDGILMNTALAAARDPVAMARAMRLAVEAGRTAYLAGRSRSASGVPSSPLEGCWIRDATAARRAALQMLDRRARGCDPSGPPRRSAREPDGAGPPLGLRAGGRRATRRAQLDRMLELATADPRLHDILRLGALPAARAGASAGVRRRIHQRRAGAGDGRRGWGSLCQSGAAQSGAGDGRREPRGRAQPPEMAC